MLETQQLAVSPQRPNMVLSKQDGPTKLGASKHYKNPTSPTNKHIECFTVPQEMKTSRANFNAKLWLQYVQVRIFLHTQQQALIDECGFKTADKYADLREMQDKHNLLSVKPVKLPHRAAQI